MNNRIRHEPLLLAWWQRLFALVVALAFLVAVVWYALRDHFIFVAASDCTDAPVGCAVQINDIPNAVIIIVLVIIAAVWLLISVGGRVPWFDVAGVSMTFPGEHEAEAQFVSLGELPARPETVNSETQRSLVAAPGGLASRDLYLTLPLEVRLALDRTWNLAFPRSLLADALIEVRPATVDGDYAWFVSARSPLDETLWLRVTLAAR